MWFAVTLLGLPAWRRANHLVYCSFGGEPTVGALALGSGGDHCTLEANHFGRDFCETVMVDDMDNIILSDWTIWFLVVTLLSDGMAESWELIYRKQIIDRTGYPV